MKDVIDGFLVLEGLDGAGTTTQSERIRDELEKRGYQVFPTFEPTDGEIGRLTSLQQTGQTIYTAETAF